MLGKTLFISYLCFQYSFRLSDIRLYRIYGELRINKHSSRHCCQQMSSDSQDIFLAKQAITAVSLHVTRIHLDIFCVMGVRTAIRWGRYILEGTGTSCTFDFLTRSTNNMSHVISIFTVHFLIPVTVISVSYYLIFKSVQKQQQEFTRVARIFTEEQIPLQVKNQKMGMKQELKTAKVSLIIILVFCIS